MDPRALPFDADAMLDGLRPWIECESPTYDAASVNRMMDLAARDLAIAGARVERIAGRMGFGDCVRATFPHATPHVPGMSPLADPLGSYLESLQGLRRLGEVSLVLPAHGHPFTDLPGRIDQIVAHHEGRLLELQKIGAALGTAKVVDLSKELFRRAVSGKMAESGWPRASERVRP